MRLAALSGATCAIISVQLACAADLSTKAPIAPLIYNWDGFYLGGHVGYGWNNIDSTTSNSNTGVVEKTSSSERDGILGGGQIGYNYMVSPNFLIGVEADFDGANLSAGNEDCLDALHCVHADGKNQWFGTVRGRLGYAHNNWLLFATGGLAWVHGTTTRTITVATNPLLVGEAATASGTDAGWTVGGGVEYGFTPHWSVNLEYRYMQVDTGRDFIYSVPTPNRHIDATEHINTVRLGVSYYFN